jgi:hypothetical protein
VTARVVDHRLADGLETWSDPAAAWGDRGVEDAAFMLQQNLMMHPARIDTERWSERIGAYEQLTGASSPVLIRHRDGA